MQRRTFLALCMATMACGCSGAVHRLPMASDGEVAAALAEVRSSGDGLRYRHASDEEVGETLRAVVDRVRGPALQVCQEIGAGVCNWQFRVARDRRFNAAAWPHGVIVLNRGLVDYAANEEELAMVIAHEIAHQAANHVARGQRNQIIGTMIGGALLGAAAMAGTHGQQGSAQTTRIAMDVGMQLGAHAGHLAYSKEQEREADYLAALILYRAGIDLEKARGVLLAMARSSHRTETTILDSHPVGPERLAAWDRAVAEIRASGGQLPPRA
ncbi:MAG: M48 family metalloprotease [Pseudomonadota bacterium]